MKLILILLLVLTLVALAVVKLVLAVTLAAAAGVYLLTFLAFSVALGEENVAQSLAAAALTGTLILAVGWAYWRRRRPPGEALKGPRRPGRR